MTPEEEARERQTVSWLRRAMCEEIDELVARLIALHALVNQLPMEPRPDPSDQLPPAED